MAIGTQHAEITPEEYEEAEIEGLEDFVVDILVHEQMTTDDPVKERALDHILNNFRVRLEYQDE